MTKAFKGYFEVATKDLSDIVTSIRWPRSVETHDVTGISHDSKAFFVGLKDGDEVSLECVWDDASDKFEDLFGGTGKLGATVALIYGPAGNTAGQRRLSANAIVKSVERATAVGSTVAGSISLQVTGDVTEDAFPA